MRESIYAQQTKTCELVLMMLKRIVQSIYNKTLYISKMLQTLPKKKNGREEYHQENCKIPFDENMSIIVNKTIETNEKEKIKPNTRNGI